ncbi:MAG: hypothetical protein M3Q58_03245 [Bacteroidota bacterium]|nr:hypothetical protein [Bacteroidota bacterium]
MTLTLSTFGQTTFKKFKEANTGQISAYADGVMWKRCYSNNYCQDVFRITPHFKGNKYYLKFEYFSDGSFCSEFSEINDNCSYGAKSCIMYLYIMLDDSEVLELSSNSYDSELNNIKFNVTAPIIKKLAEASKLDIKRTVLKQEIYDRFPYTFKDSEINGFYDFAIGMNIIK